MEPVVGAAPTNASLQGKRGRWANRQWSLHRDLRPALLLTKQSRRYLRFEGKMVVLSGAAPEHGANLAHLRL